MYAKLVALFDSEMSQQQVTQPRPSCVNGFDRSRTDRDPGSHYDNRSTQSPNSRLGNSGNTSMGHDLYGYMKSEHVGHPNHNKVQGGNASISRRGGFGRPLHDRLLFMTACLIGQPVEVQVKNGSIFSGIFHTTNAEKDYGVVLRMARLIKDGSNKGEKYDAVKDAASKAPIKTLIILANDLVQVIAKDVQITGDELANGHACQNKHDIVIDSFLSQAHRVELERELEPWTPDKDAPENLGLEDTFQNTWNRNWDQFETNKALFGVKSTYDEELYTTKLERGPQMKDMEKEASRIAREIEGQVTRNFHLAEERGIHVPNELDSLDEESRFSSVLRELGDDVGEDDEDTCIDNHNEETFSSNFPHSGVAPTVCKDSNGCIPDLIRSENNSNPTYLSLSAGSSEISSSGCDQLEVQAANLDTNLSNFTVNNCRKTGDSSLEDNSKKCKKQLKDKVNTSAEVLQNKIKVAESHSKKLPVSGEQLSSMDKQTELVPKEEMSVPTNRVLTSVHITEVAYAPPASALPMPTGLGGLSATSSIYTHLEGTKCIAEPSPSATSRGSLIRTGSSSSLGTDLTATTVISTFSVSSPGSSVGSASSEKSTLNPFAKEFKLNPNAKSFTPCQSGLRTSSPGGQGPFPMPSNIPPVTHMHGLSLGLGSSSLVQQPIQPLKFGPQSNSLTASGVTSATYYQPAASFSPNASGSSILTSFPAVSAGRIPAGQQIGHSFSGHHHIMYNSQAPSVQSASTYIHQNGHLYPQHMMLGQPGQVVYIPPFPQGPPPPHGLIPSFATPQQGQQPKHRGGS